MTTSTWGAPDALSSLDAYVNPVCNPKAKHTPIVIRSDTAIGSFKTLVPAGGTLANAYDTFGAPNAIRRDGQECIVQWKVQALSMSFANLQGGDPCERDTGFFVKAKMTGKRWRTDKKLAVGDTVAQLKRKYPKAKTAGSPKVFGLLFRPEPASVGGGRVPRLLANVSTGTIRWFEVAQSNAGE